MLAASVALTTIELADWDAHATVAVHDVNPFTVVPFVRELQFVPPSVEYSTTDTPDVASEVFAMIPI